MNKTLKKFAVSVATVAALAFGFSPVLAAGSVTSNGVASGEVQVNHETVDGSYAQFSDTFSDVTDQKILDEINALNGGKALSDVLGSEKVATVDGVDLKDYALLTKVQDLKAYDKDNKALTENVTVTWEVPNLTDSLKSVYVLHYSTARSTWEVIKPDALKYDSKEITTTFKDLSPVAVIYKSSEAKSDATTSTTPNTGAATHTAAYVGTGVVAIAVIGLVAYKKHTA